MTKAGLTGPEMTGTCLTDSGVTGAGLTGSRRTGSGFPGSEMTGHVSHWKCLMEMWKGFSHTVLLCVYVCPPFTASAF